MTKEKNHFKKKHEYSKLGKNEKVTLLLEWMENQFPVKEDVLRLSRNEKDLMVKHIETFENEIRKLM